MSLNFSCWTIFCDDIRHEINGKMSLMGMYGNIMYVPDFPYTAPKLCAFFELRVQPDRDAATDATLTVMKGAEKISSITLPITSLDDSNQVPHGKPFAFGSTSGGMEFPSMTFTEPTLVEIAAQIDGQSTIGGRLWVAKYPQNEEVANPNQA